MFPLWDAFNVGTTSSLYPIPPAVAPAPALKPATDVPSQSRPLSAGKPACNRSAISKRCGRGLPLSCALRRMPRQALLLK